MRLGCEFAVNRLNRPDEEAWRWHTGEPNGDGRGTGVARACDRRRRSPAVAPLGAALAAASRRPRVSHRRHRRLCDRTRRATGGGGGAVVAAGRGERTAAQATLRELLERRPELRERLADDPDLGPLLANPV